MDYQLAGNVESNPGSRNISEGHRVEPIKPISYVRDKVSFVVLHLKIFRNKLELSYSLLKATFKKQLSSLIKPTMFGK